MFKSDKAPYIQSEPIAETARSKAWVCGRSLAGVVGSNYAGVKDVSLSLVCVVFCQVVRRSYTESGVSECVRETP